jgi:hypothetical protein
VVVKLSFTGQSGLVRVERVHSLDKPPKFPLDGSYGQKQKAALQPSIPANVVASYPPSGTVTTLLNLSWLMSLSLKILPST